MKDYVNDYLSATAKLSPSGAQSVRDRFVCADGTSLSIQANKFMYCTPREDGMSFYSAVEVGYPNIRPPDTWRRYAEDWPSGFVSDTWETLKNWWRVTLSGQTTLRRLYLRKLLTGKARNTVYAYIPVDLVNEFIEDHGGPKERE